MVRNIGSYLKKLLYFTLFTLSAANIDQSEHKTWAQYLCPTEFEFDHGSSRTEQLKLFGLELGNIAAFDFVYLLESKQSAPNFVTVYMSIRSQMSLIMGQVIPDQSMLSFCP